MEEKIRGYAMSSGELIAQKIFDSVVRRYDSFLNTVTFGFINHWQYELINNLPAGDTCVDIGTGTGEIVKKLNSIYPETRIIGVDVSMAMLMNAMAKVEKNPKDIFIRASALKLPLRDESVNSITSSLTFRHLPLEEAAEEFRRVLKPDGYLGILDISKPKSEKFFKFVDFFSKKIFRPVGSTVFSKEEYEYFIESIDRALTPEELADRLSLYSFEQVYQASKFYGLVTISIFRKEQ